MQAVIKHTDTLVVGAGLTGLCVAHELHKRGADFLLVERSSRAGGQIRSYQEEGFIYESGPNTGIISHAEVAELFDDFPQLLQTARPEAKRRFILKDGKFRPLPSGLKSAITTNLFTWRDKLRILGEPWRSAGTDADESIASLVRRRLGESYYRYAVDPFVGGIYAGDAERLVTRYALPKLYALEERYGSFVRGAMALMRKPKTERELRASKEIFSARGGLMSLTDAMASEIGDKLMLGVQGIRAYYQGEKEWIVRYEQAGEAYEVHCRHLVTTIGTEELADLLSPLAYGSWADIRAMRYAPIVQVVLGYKQAPRIDFEAFGGLIPSCEDGELLGVLNPSASFEGRCPEGGLLLSAFLGGMRSPKLIERSDEEISLLTLSRLERVLGLEQAPDLIRIFRHERAIPQYERSTGQRLANIRTLESLFDGLYIGGNMLDGIGMPDRIKQGRQLAERVN